MMWRNRDRGGNVMWPRPGRWHDMRRLRRDMDYLLGGTSAPIRSSYPAINLWAGNEGAIVTAEIPGVNPDELNIAVDGDMLTVGGNRQRDLPEGAKYHRRERAYGEFSRTIQLPFQADADNVSATYQRGILQIDLPRIPEEKPKKIEINSN